MKKTQSIGKFVEMHLNRNLQELKTKIIQAERGCQEECAQQGLAHSGYYQTKSLTRVVEIINNDLIKQFEYVVKETEENYFKVDKFILKEIQDQFKNYIDGIIIVCKMHVFNRIQSVHKTDSIDIQISAVKPNLNNMLDHHIKMYDLVVKNRNDNPAVKTAKKANILSIIETVSRFV